MTLNMEFTVTARCRVYDKSDDSKEPYTEDIDLHLNKDQAMGLLLRFAPSHFALDEFKISFHKDGIGDIDGIILIKDNKHYVIKNTNQFISDVHEGYFRLLMLNKLSSLLEMPEIAFDDSEVVDEFV